MFLVYVIELVRFLKSYNFEGFRLFYRYYGNIGRGVSSSGILNRVYFSFRKTTLHYVSPARDLRTSLQWSKLIFVIKGVLKLGNLAQKVPTLQFESFMIIFVTIIQVFKGGKLFKWGNYSNEDVVSGENKLVTQIFGLDSFFVVLTTFQGFVVVRAEILILLVFWFE